MEPLSIFHREIPMNYQTVARIVADKLGLKVVYNDSIRTFCIERDDTTGEMTIHLASQVLSASKDDEAALELLVRGAIAHEALGHGYHTDFNARANTPYGKSLANLIEDIRIERLAPSRYAGSARILRDFIVHLDTTQDFFVPSDNCIDEEALFIGLLRSFRTDILNQPLSVEVTNRALTQARNWLGDELFKQVEGMARQGCYAPNTTEVCKIADAIVDLLKQSKKPEQPPPPQPQQDQQKNQQQQNQQQEQQQQQQGSAGSNQDKQEQGDGSTAEDLSDDQTQGGKSGDGDSTEQQKADNQTGDKSDENKGDQTGQQQSESTLSESGDQSQQKGGQQPAPQQQSPQLGDADDALDFSERMSIEREIQDVFEKAIEAMTDRTDIDLAPSDLTEAIIRNHNSPTTRTFQVRGLIQKLKSRMEEALRAVVEDEDDQESHVGRLDTTKLARIVTGSEDYPFLLDGDPGQGLSTELLVLFDKSTSMQRFQLEFLQDLIYAAGTALGAYAPDVRFSLAWYNTQSQLVHQSNRHWTPKHGSAVASSYFAKGGTNWSASVLPLIPLIANSRKVRKVLVTVCDGDINYDLYPSLLRDLEKHRIETSFVCIDSEVPPGLDGVTCEATQDSFARAFLKAVLKAISPEFV
jgi:hypothetical protein